MKRYFIKTYGCQMNDHDSEIMKYTLESLDYHESELLEDADLIIYNTCAVRQNAEHKVYGHLGSLKGKPAYAGKTIAVCGCMMQSEPIRSYILKTFPNVGLIFGTHSIDRLEQLLDEHRKTGKTVVDIQEENAYVHQTFHAVRPKKFKGYVNIAYGCDNYCSFCIVPYTRGRERSRRLEDIVEEVQQLVCEGVLEITLLGQNVNSYGKTSQPPSDFVSLLKALHAIRGLKRIRFMTPHPRDIHDDFLKCYRDIDTLMPQLHLPIQSGSDRVLREMHRNYTMERYRQIVSKARSYVPDLALTTDIIVGYPTETEGDFEKTLEAVREMEYDAAYTFLYSPRPHTPAAHLKPLPDHILRERYQTLTNALNEIALRKHRANIGKVTEVLIESFDAQTLKIEGRNPQGRLVICDGQEEDVGRILSVKINDANTFTSFGKKVV